MAIAPSSRKLKRTSFQHAKPYSRPTRQISLPTPSPSPTPSPTLHHNSVFAVSCLKPHQADRHFEDPFEHEHELETEIQKTIRLRKEEAATAAYIKACPGCKRSIFRVFDRVVDNKNMACASSSLHNPPSASLSLSLSTSHSIVSSLEE